MSDHWEAEAACATEDPDAWFSEGAYRNYDVARTICVNDCAVRQQCLAFALSEPLLTYGMYGGHTPEERRTLRRRARKAAS